MAARSPAEAVEAYFDALQQAVSCITPAVLTGRIYRPTTEPQTLTFGRERSVPVGRNAAFRLRVRIHYVVDEIEAPASAWAVRPVGYAFRLLDREERGILSYHWHPVGRSHVTFPHFHLDLRTSPLDLSKAHFPTGMISLVDVIRLAIVDLGVEPHRTDWRAVLERTRQAM